MTSNGPGFSTGSDGQPTHRPSKAVKSTPKDEAVTTATEEETVDQMNLPKISVPKPSGESDMVNDKSGLTTAFKWAFIGCGQAGSRLVDSFHQLGFNRVCCINTTDQDMDGLKMPKDNQYVMNLGVRGAGKNPDLGKSAIKEHYEDVYDLMKRSWKSGWERVLVCAGLGGGTGTGTIETVLAIANEIAESYKAQKHGEPPVVGALVTLPSDSESQKVHANAHAALKQLVSMTTGGKRLISPLIIIDNQRMYELYSSQASTGYLGVTNQSVTQLFLTFNVLATGSSDIWTFDEADFKTVLESGIVTFGMCNIPKYEDPTSISFSVRDNIRNTMLVKTDIGNATTAALVFIGSNGVLSKIPQKNFEHAFDMIKRMISRNNTVHRGVYRNADNELTCFAMLGGLDVSGDRLAELARLAGTK